MKKEGGFQFTVHAEGEERLPAWALLICPHVLFRRLPIRCALDDRLSSRIHESENLEIRAPGSPRIRNLGTRNPGVRVRGNPGIRNLGTKTWVPEHGNAGSPKHGYANLDTKICVTRTWALETRPPGHGAPGTWKTGNLGMWEPKGANEAPRPRPDDDAVLCLDGMAKMGTEWLLARLSPSCQEGMRHFFPCRC